MVTTGKRQARRRAPLTAGQLGRTRIYMPTVSRIATASVTSSVATEDDERAER
jgi:hypothetical protein